MLGKNIYLYIYSLKIHLKEDQAETLWHNLSQYMHNGKTGQQGLLSDNNNVPSKQGIGHQGSCNKNDASQFTSQPITVRGMSPQPIPAPQITSQDPPRVTLHTLCTKEVPHQRARVQNAYSFSWISSR